MNISKAVLALLCSAAPAVVNGHGYMNKPMSRNKWASLSGNGLEYDKEGHPRIDVDANALNANTPGACGKSQNWEDAGPGKRRDYSEWLDSTGKPMPWMSQETYAQGDTIEVQVVLDAEHCGFFEFKGCPKGRGSSQACFDHYPLMLAEDVTEWKRMPNDPNHPERAHFAFGAAVGNKPSYGGSIMGRILTYKMKLPEDLVGEEVLIQMMYWTANSCQLPGYTEYITEHSGMAMGDDSYCTSRGKCLDRSQIPMMREPNFATDHVPEIFWNCAEVTITGTPQPIPDFEADEMPDGWVPVPEGGGGGGGAAPPPGCLELGKPLQDSSVQGTCVDGKRGNGICPDQNMCCSDHGWCGTSATYCGCAVYDNSGGDEESGDGSGSGDGGTTPPPPNGGGNSGGDTSGGCCSVDFKSCDANLAARDPESCEAGGSHKWLPDGDLEGCFASFGDCRKDMMGCCPGLVCEGNSNWASCKVGGRRTAVRAF